MTKIKEFGGVKYTQENINPINTKVEANKIAKKMRQNGKHVRVTKNKSGYMLWSRVTRPTAKKSMHIRMG